MSLLTIRRNDKDLHEQQDMAIEYLLYDLWNRKEPAKSTELFQQDATAMGNLSNNVKTPFSYHFPVSVGSTANAKNISGQLEESTFAVQRQFKETELLRFWNEYLCDHWQELSAKFKGRYVAVWENEVIDSDEDLGHLAERVYSCLGYRPVFMPYISEKEQVYEFLGHI